MIELRIRKFYKTEDGALNLAPSIVLMANEGVSTIDMPKHLAALSEMVADLPPSIGPIREMTAAEVEAYLEEEDAE